MIRTYLTAICTAAIISAGATDYTVLNGKCGADLKSAIKNVAEVNLNTVSYGDKTWNAFQTTDVRMVNGREAWYDMYSNRLVYVESGHDGMNIEHSVANSWWGGTKGDAYKDLYHLNPSDADANNRKSHNPLGIIEGEPTWSNGLTRIGAPTPATGGGSGSVFEPADEYKGDFARAYFYIFTLYDDIAWEEKYDYMYDLSSYPTLKPWATEMLLRWAAEDPVDQREIARARAVAGIQMNVNPYVEVPELAEYVWGSKCSTPFTYTEPVYAPNRPEAPTFGEGYTLAGVNTWVGRWWDGFAMTLTAPAGDIYYTLGDGDDYQLYEGPIAIPTAGVSGQTLTVKAYATEKYNGVPYRGSVATLTLTAREAGGIDYMNAKWRRVTSDEDINDQNIYILGYVAGSDCTLMGCTAKATGSSGYIEVAGASVIEDDIINTIPEGTGLLKLIPAGGTQYYVSVNNISFENVGYLSSTVAKFVRIEEEGTEVGISASSDKNVVMDMGTSIGTIQYNKTSPRFSVYTSKQQPVSLFRCIDDPSGNLTIVTTPVEIGTGTAVWYDLNGRRVDIDRAESGIYIKVTPQGAVKIRK